MFRCADRQAVSKGGAGRLRVLIDEAGSVVDFVVDDDVEVLGRRC
jgi:hypothetical protein